MTTGQLTRLGGSAMVSFAALTLSCSGTKKIDGETHFLCAVDADCTPALGSDYGCVRNSCVKLASKTSTLSCFPGQTSSCVGQSGCSGTKACADGGSFGACVCPDASGVFSGVPRADGGASGCVTAEFEGEQVSRALYVLLDQSAKMNETPGDAGGTWWQAATGGIEDFFTGPVQTVGSFGLQYFPLGSAPSSCELIYGTPDARITSSFGFQPIVASLAAHSPQGLAATGPALQGALSYLKGQSVGIRSAVLITAGAPGECQPNTIADLADIAAGALGSDPQVFTYVIALGEAATLFDPVAAAGGTTLAFKITGGNVRRAVSDAFVDIVGFHVACTFDAGQLAGPSTTLDPSSISLSFDFPDGGTTAVTPVQSAADCASLDRDGWYFNYSTRKVVLCPDLCDHPRASLRYEYGCRPPVRAADGGAACGDGVCSPPESAFSCPNDCTGFCGDGVCESGETATSCPPDCDNCGSAEKLCRGTCVRPTPENGCDSPTCAPCATAPPPNSAPVCNPYGKCDFTCWSGFRRSGDHCVSIFGDAAAD